MTLLCCYWRTKQTLTDNSSYSTAMPLSGQGAVPVVLRQHFPALQLQCLAIRAFLASMLAVLSVTLLHRFYICEMNIHVRAMCMRVLDVGFELGGQSDVRYLVLQVHYKFAYTGLCSLSRCCLFMQSSGQLATRSSLTHQSSLPKCRLLLGLYTSLFTKHGSN